jgi:hypothetical protein
MWQPQKIQLRHMIGDKMFSIAICGMKKSFWLLTRLATEIFLIPHKCRPKHSIAIKSQLKFFNRCKRNNQKVFQFPQGLQQLK